MLLLQTVTVMGGTATTDPRDMKSMHIVLCQFWNAVVVKYQNSQAYTNTGILSNRLIELNLTKQHTRSISRSSKSLRGHTRVRHMATRTGVCESACVRACAVWFTFPANKETLTVPLVRGSVPETPLCQHLLSLTRSHRTAEALLRTRFSVPLSTNALGKTPQLRKKAQLCSKRSVERPQDTNSGFWPAEKTKKRQRAEDSQPSRNSSETSAGSTLTRPLSPQMESTCAAHCEQREILNDLDADNGDTKRTTTEHAKPTRANVPLPPLKQNQPHARVLFTQKIHSPSTWSFQVIRKHPFTTLTPMGRRHLLTSAGSANEEETNSNGEPPSMYRRPACPVNDKREAATEWKK